MVFMYIKLHLTGLGFTVGFVIAVYCLIFVLQGFGVIREKSVSQTMVHRILSLLYVCKGSIIRYICKMQDSLTFTVCFSKGLLQGFFCILSSACCGFPGGQYSRLCWSHCMMRNPDYLIASQPGLIVHEQSSQCQLNCLDRQFHW